MEEQEEQGVSEVSSIEIEIPRGGPIYVPNLVGPLTKVPDFQSAVVHQLQNLEAELCLDSSQLCHHDDDITVDDLKIFTEEELVNMAFKEAFKDGDTNNPQRKKVGPQKSTGKHACLDSSGRGENTSASFDAINASHSGTTCNQPITKNKSSKIKKRKATNLAVKGSYIAKVEELAKIKQKQDEDKAAATLHSFNDSCKMNESAIPPSERIERMKSLRSTNSASKQLKSSNTQENRAVLYPEENPEVVLCVEVYHNKRKWVKTQELLVLGCQALTELRDKICCLTDQVMLKAGQHDPSGYFLIEDVFCNDLRDPSAIEYSDPIFDWLRNSKDDALRKWECINTGELQQKQKAVVGNVTTSDLPHFKAFDMHKLRFSDLRFRLGAGYLYCHQGACKHVIVIRDMRLIHPEDVHNRAAYPIVIFQLKLRPQKCKVCKIYRASKVTLDDKWAQENPCYFCDYCYSLLHSKDAAPLYSDCTVYDYLHD